MGIMKTELNITYKKRTRKYLTENKKIKEVVRKVEEVNKCELSTK